MYFKVIKSGTNRKLVYDFLFVFYSNFCPITHRFRKIWCETVQWPWNMPKSLTVVSPESCSVAMYVKCSELRKTVTEWTENRHFLRPHSHLTPPLQRTTANICINLILPETTFPELELHFCRWQYMGSSASFRVVLPESRRSQPISCRARNRF